MSTIFPEDEGVDESELDRSIAESAREFDERFDPPSITTTHIAATRYDGGSADARDLSIERANKRRNFSTITGILENLASESRSAQILQEGIWENPRRDRFATLENITDYILGNAPEDEYAHGIWESMQRHDMGPQAVHTLQLLLLGYGGDNGDECVEDLQNHYSLFLPIDFEPEDTYWPDTDFEHKFFLFEQDASTQANYNTNETVRVVVDEFSGAFEVNPQYALGLANDALTLVLGMPDLRKRKHRTQEFTDSLREIGQTHEIIPHPVIGVVQTAARILQTQRTNNGGRYNGLKSNLVDRLREVYELSN